MGDSSTPRRGGGGFRGRSPGRGFSRGHSGDRGSRGGFRGSRGGGGFRGSRGGGGFRDRDDGGSRGRGGFRGRGDGGSRGRGGFSGFRGRGDGGRGRDGGSSRGRGGMAMSGGKGSGDKLKDAPQPFFEIRDGLSLTAEFKEKISTDDLKARFNDLHMVSAAKTQGKSYLLFKTVHAMEKAHKKLSADDNIASVEFCGYRSPRYSDEVNKLVVVVPESMNETKVKGLHSGILSVSPFPGRENTYYIDFESPDAAVKAETEMASKKFSSGIESVRYSQGLRNHVVAKINQLPTCVCLRDVPKSATLQDIVEVAPAAIGIRMYKNTFPASEYCHASIDFSTAEEASSFISEQTGSLKIAGSKVVVLPGVKSLLADDPILGESKGSLNQKRKKEKEEKGEKPAKKQKLDAEPVKEEPADGNAEEGGDDETEDEEGDEDESEDDEEADAEEGEDESEDGEDEEESEDE